MDAAPARKTITKASCMHHMFFDDTEDTLLYTYRAAP